MRIRLCIFLFVLVQNSWAQLNINGRLLDSITQQPIEFANIGLLGRGFGTVSDEQGRFAFSVPDSVADELVRVSIIGYKPKSIPARTFAKLETIRLQQSSTSLGEVTVTAKKTKIKILGNETQTKMVSGGFVKNNLGAEMAIKLRIKQPKTQLRKLCFNINRNTLHKQPIFRFNLYSEDSEGMPGNNILVRNIIIEPKDTLGLVELDLTPFQIYVDQDVFISLEWIKDLGDVKGLYFSTKLASGTTYFRLVSQDKWQKRSGIGVGLYAEVAY